MVLGLRKRERFFKMLKFKLFKDLNKNVKTEYKKNDSASWTFFFGDVAVAQLVALMSGELLGGVAEVVGSNLARGKIFPASIGSNDPLYP